VNHRAQGVGVGAQYPNQVLVCVARVEEEGQVVFGGEGELRGEVQQLGFLGREVQARVVKAALSD